MPSTKDRRPLELIYYEACLNEKDAFRREKYLKTFKFGVEARRAVSVEIYPGVLAKVVTLKTLLEMKRAAGRPQDLIDIKELQRIQ